MNGSADKALEILERTNDGADLDPNDLYLLQLWVNHSDDRRLLTEDGIAAFDSLHERVMNGTYVRPWLCGVEHMTQDHEGYVYWKGIRLDHFSHEHYLEMKEDVEDFARYCRVLEASGQEVTAAKVLWHDWNEPDPALADALAAMPRPKKLTEKLVMEMPGQSPDDYDRAVCYWEIWNKWPDTYCWYDHFFIDNWRSVSLYQVKLELTHELDRTPTEQEMADCVTGLMRESIKELSSKNEDDPRIYGLVIGKRPENRDTEDTRTVSEIWYHGEQIDEAKVAELAATLDL